MQNSKSAIYFGWINLKIQIGNIESRFVIEHARRILYFILHKSLSFNFCSLFKKIWKLIGYRENRFPSRLRAAPLAAS